MQKQLHATRKSYFLKMLIGIVALLLLIRLLLPYAILRYAEYRLDKIPDYKVSIGDLDLQLYKGRYIIKDLELRKINRHIPVPFFSARAITLAVEWAPLWHGHLVAQLAMDEPSLNFVVDPSGEDEQTSIDEEWQRAVKALFPLHFNRITISKGQAHLRNFKGKPSYDLYLKSIDVSVENLRNTAQLSSAVPASLQLNAKTMDGAAIHFNMQFDPNQQSPTFDLDAEVQKMQVSAINDFLHYYTKLDIKQGLFSLYVEAAAKQGKISGYIKPLIEHLRLNDPAEKTSAATKVYKGAIQAVTKLFENPKKKTVATKVKITGDIEDPNISIWSVVTNLLKNAFIQALLPQLDHSIELNDVNLNK